MVKLFKVQCQGISLGPYYVIAKDPTTAYKLVRSNLDKRNYGYYKDREMKNIELLAEANEYNSTEELFVDLESFFVNVSEE
jgi:hypothetical protein